MPNKAVVLSLCFFIKEFNLIKILKKSFLCSLCQSLNSEEILYFRDLAVEFIRIDCRKDNAKAERR